MGHSYDPPWTRPVDFLAAQDKARAVANDDAQAAALARAGSDALRLLAERMYPDDLAKLGERWRMPVLMRELWVRAYVTGFRDANLPGESRDD